QTVLTDLGPVSCDLGNNLSRAGREAHQAGVHIAEQLPVVHGIGIGKVQAVDLVSGADDDGASFASRAALSRLFGCLFFSGLFSGCLFSRLLSRRFGGFRWLLNSWVLHRRR